MHPIRIIWPQRLYAIELFPPTVGELNIVTKSERTLHLVRANTTKITQPQPPGVRGTGNRSIVYSDINRSIKLTDNRERRKH